MDLLCNIERALAGAAAPEALEAARKLCTCDGAGQGPDRECVVKAGGQLWLVRHGLEPHATEGAGADAMTVAELREALAQMPDHWAVFLAVLADRSGGGADEEFLYTLERKAGAFPSQGNMAVVRANYEAS